MSEEVAIVEISNRDEPMLHLIGRLRVIAWSADVHVAADMGMMLDGFDQVARHFVILSSGQPIASARLTIHYEPSAMPDWAECCHLPLQLTSPIAAFGRMVVHPAFRRQGLSLRLDQCRILAARAMGCRSILAVTSSGQYRIRQLESLGLRIVGNRNCVPIQGCIPRPGVVMVGNLPKTGVPLREGS